MSSNATIFLVVILLVNLSALPARMLYNSKRDKEVLTHQSKGDQRAVKSRQDTFCEKPVSKEKVIFPDSLAGRAHITYDIYSGYVPVSTSPDYLYYLFYGTKDGNPNAPLIIFTNGGPGCSSMEGATTEVGPLVLFDIKEACTPTKTSSCDYTNQLSDNAYAWNAHANLLFIDQPRNVGNSFGYSDSEVRSCEEAADDFIVFFQRWLELFPELVGRPVIISGESYAGHYLPAWSSAILDFNANAQAPINLAGIVIGNGCTNDTVQNDAAYYQFLRETKLIPSTFSPSNRRSAEIKVEETLGYEPNYYDYRAKLISCPACYGYNYTAWSNWFLREDVKAAMHICGDAGEDAFSGSAGGCINIQPFDVNNHFDYSGALARALDADIPVVLYYGMTDTACNYVGGLKLAETIPWKGASKWMSNEMKPLVISGAEMGGVKSDSKLTYIQIQGAGHMVPLDNAAASAFAIGLLVENILTKEE